MTNADNEQNMTHGDFLAQSVKRLGACTHAAKDLRKALETVCETAKISGVSVDDLGVVLIQVRQEVPDNA